MKRVFFVPLTTMGIFSVLLFSCSNDKQTEKVSLEKYQLVMLKDTVPLDISKKLKEGIYIFDKKNNILKYADEVTGGPVDPVVVEREHQAYRTAHGNATNAVNFTLFDIGGFYNNVIEAAKVDGVTVDSFRIKFLVYDTAPLINGHYRPDYIGRESVALVAMSGGREYTTTSSAYDIRPRNLGTLCPVCQ
jgi:hypothetical protein